jgi:multiple sugar transport system permease protein
MALILSFSKWNFISGIRGIRLVGISNYLKLFGDPVFATSLVNTIAYAFAMVPVSIALSLVLGVILNEYVFGKGCSAGFLLAVHLFHGPRFDGVDDLYIPSYGPINNFLTASGSRIRRAGSTLRARPCCRSSSSAFGSPWATT